MCRDNTYTLRGYINTQLFYVKIFATTSRYNQMTSNTETLASVLVRHGPASFTNSLHTAWCQLKQ